MATHLRLASLDGTAVLPQQAARTGTSAARRNAGSPRADHSTFRAMVSGLHDSGLESTLRGLLASVAIVEEERLRRLGLAVRESVPSLRTVPSHAPAERTAGHARAGLGAGEAGKRAVRAIVAADADIRPGERLVSEAGTPLAYEFSGRPWALGRAAAERRGVPHLGGKRVCYAWGRPLVGDAPDGAASVPF